MLVALGIPELTDLRVELSCLTTRRIPSLAQFEATHSFDALIIGRGFRTSAEVTENLGALGWEISNADMAEIDVIFDRHGAITLPPGWLED